MLDLANPLEQERLDRAVQEAVEAAQVGFYYEEGGCWAFAVAMFEALRDLKITSSLRVQESDFVHAWVEVEGTHWDYRGQMTNPNASAPSFSRKAFEGIAARYGMPKDVLTAEAAAARDIVDDAFRRAEVMFA